MLWFKNKDINAEKFEAIQDRLNKLECDHEYTRIFMDDNTWYHGNLYIVPTQVCSVCKKVLELYKGQKDYLTAKNEYMAELIAKNEKIISDIKE